MKKYLSVLRNTVLFSGISDEDILLLSGCLGCLAASCKDGGTLWRTGERVSRAGIVLAGGIRAESVTAGGDLRIVARHGPGDIFGDILMSAEGSLSPVDIVAYPGTEILFIPLTGIMRSCPKSCACHDRLRLNLLDEIAKKYWLQNRRVRYLSEPGLRGRIALYLTDCALAAGAGAFTVPFSREEMAAYLCVNRSALSRELGRMRSEGLLSFCGSRFSYPLCESKR